MERYFPADVSLRVSGELADAQQLFPQAKQLLSRATRMVEAGAPLAKLFMPGTDGSLIYCYLHGPVKILYVQPAPPVAPPIEGVVTPPELEEPAAVYLEMLNGVVHPGTLVADALHEFHPTQICADTYQLSFSWQDMARLAVAPDPAISSEDMQVKFPKPSNYSGAMKRVVQALYGLGKIDPTVNNWVGDTEYVTQNHYDYRWSRTDGVLKVGIVSWLVRISKVDGVLAMPLPLFAGTTTDDFASMLEVLGDSETYTILQEFGGLPSGEDFPTGTALTDAITAGTVLRLLTANDIGVFYQFSGDLLGGTPIAKNAYFTGCGWAFSHSGTTAEVHNTCWWYSNPEIAFASWWEDGWYRDGHNGAPPEQRYMRSEHWKITLDIPNGTAVLALVEMQPVEAPNSYTSSFGLNTNIASTMYPLQPGHSTDLGGFDFTYYPYQAISSATGAVRFGYGNNFGAVTSGPPSFVSSGGAATYNGYGLATGDYDVTRNWIVCYGFNPTVNSGQLTVSGHSSPEWWCHSALMLVPGSSNAPQLRQFTFWGRSRAWFDMFVDMEPAYAAPVFVFYIGEQLEIVRRQAERWTKTGGYTMGDFWATSLDLRLTDTFIPLTNPYDPYSNNGPDTQATSGHIGLIIPEGVRESYVLMRSVWDQKHATYAEVKPVGIFAGADGTKTTIEFHRRYSTSTADGVFYEVWPRWYYRWTSVYTNPIVKMSMSLNSGPSLAYHAYDGPYPNWNQDTTLFDLNLVLPPPPPPTFTTVIPDITLPTTSVEPTDVTFVGAV